MLPAELTKAATFSLPPLTVRPASAGVGVALASKAVRISPALAPGWVEA